MYKNIGERRKKLYHIDFFYTFAYRIRFAVMTIIQLEYLLAVANCGSFSLAAEHCFVTQPSLSMQVKSLEEELGVVLLDRSKKPVIPTEAGEAVLAQARDGQTKVYLAAGTQEDGGLLVCAHGVCPCACFPDLKAAGENGRWRQKTAEIRGSAR